MPQPHQIFRPVATVKLLEIMFRNNCWPTTFHTITAGDAYEWCMEWVVWSTLRAMNFLSEKIFLVMSALYFAFQNGFLFFFFVQYKDAWDHYRIPLNWWTMKVVNCKVQDDPNYSVIVERYPFPNRVVGGLMSDVKSSLYLTEKN